MSSDWFRKPGILLKCGENMPNSTHTHSTKEEQPWRCESNRPGQCSGHESEINKMRYSSENKWFQLQWLAFIPFKINCISSFKYNKDNCIPFTTVQFGFITILCVLVFLMLFFFTMFCSVWIRYWLLKRQKIVQWMF